MFGRESLAQISACFLIFAVPQKQLADKNQWKPCMDKIFYESRAGAGDILVLA